MLILVNKINSASNVTPGADEILITFVSAGSNEFQHYMYLVRIE